MIKIDFKEKSIYSIILVNLIPIFGILFSDWNLFSILIFYWLESAVIGLFNVVKMASAKVSKNYKMILFSNSKPLEFNIQPLIILLKIFLISFFFFHFGGFMLFHLIFIYAISSLTGVKFNFSTILYSVLVPAVFLLISHGYSFYLNYIVKKEYIFLDVKELMFAPYKRVILMHIAIVVGSFIILGLGAPSIFAIIFIFAKTYLDINAHKNEHKISMGYDFSRKWDLLIQLEKEKLGVDKLTTEQMTELYSKVYDSKYQ